MRPSRRLVVAVPALLASATFVVAAGPAHAADPSTLYVWANSHCSDSGTGSHSENFCSLQAAANVVQPGQTIAVLGPTAESGPTVTFTRSGTPTAPITVIGNPGEDLTSVTQLRLNLSVAFTGVHDVELTHFNLWGEDGETLAQVNNSQRVTLDRMSVEQGPAITATTVGADIVIDGDSSDVTVSRTAVGNYAAPAIRVAPGAAQITLTADDVRSRTASVISLSGVTDAAVTSNNVTSSSCGGGIVIDGASTAAVENNLVGVKGGSTCTAPVPELSVSADSTSGVREDYNAYSVPGNNTVTEYSWGGTSYPSVNEFRTATGQGQHDLETGAIPSVGGSPPEHSPLVDSADPQAPGELSTDFTGKPRVDDPLVANTGGGPPTPDRGAYERQDTLSLSDAITPSPTTATAPLTVSVTLTSAPTSNWSEPLTVTVSFGDGSADVPLATGATVTHTYAAGYFTATTTATNRDGTQAVSLHQVVVNVGPSPLTAAPTGFYNPDDGGRPEVFVNGGGSLYQDTYTMGRGWSTWNVLGGQSLTGEVVAFHDPSSGDTEVFANSGGHLVEKFETNGSWSDWVDLGGTIDGQPTVFHNPKYGTTEVYARSGTHVIYKYNSGGTWSGWMDLGGNISGDPAVIYNQKYGTTEIYARSGISAVYEYYSGTSWSGWNSLDGNLSGDPTVFYDTRTSRTEVYARSGSQLWYRYYSGTAWSGWNNLGGNVSGDPAVLYNPTYGTTEVYERSGTDIEYAYSSGGTTFSGWTNLGGNVTSDPSVSYYVEGRSTQIYVNSNGEVHDLWYIPQNGWGTWARL